jgi:hypothetical protein
VALTSENAAELWNAALSRMSGMVVEQARQFDSVAISAPNRLAIRFRPGYAVSKSVCERPEQVARFEQALAEVAGQRIRVEFVMAADEPGVSTPAAASARATSPHQQRLEAMQNPLVRRVTELFDAHVERIIEPPVRE